MRIFFLSTLIAFVLVSCKSSDEEPTNQETNNTENIETNTTETNGLRATVADAPFYMVNVAATDTEEQAIAKAEGITEDRI